MQKETQKEQEKKALLQAIQETQKELITIIQKGKVKNNLVSDMLQLCHKYIVAYGDKSFLINLFFKKVGNTTFYNYLQLKQYYLEQEIVIEYSVKKDKLYIIGDIANIKESFIEYKKRLQNERKKELASLTDKEKIEKTFKSKIESLTDKQKAYLIDLIK